MFIFATNLLQRLCPISGNRNKLPGKADFFRTVSYSAASKEIHVLSLYSDTLLARIGKSESHRPMPSQEEQTCPPWDGTQSNGYA